MNDFNKNLVDDLRANAGKPSSGPFVGRDVLILTTRGARSGQLRENPLAYTQTGDDLIVIASKGGAPTNPDWFHNLVANPTVTVEVLGESFPARTRVLTEGEEYESLYKQQADRMPAFWEYRQKTSRKIPVVVLERLSAVG
jgi:deazaflavin-dependent oxidoreductase (nitroreductase family)